eukprot:g16333.t1
MAPETSKGASPAAFIPLVPVVVKTEATRTRVVTPVEKVSSESGSEPPAAAEIGVVGLTCRTCEGWPEVPRALDRRSSERRERQAFGTTYHLDLCGPVTLSICGCMYLLVVLDNFSRYMLVYGLRWKSAALDGFKVAITDLAKYGRGNIETIRVDMGTEWTSDVFRMFCANAGIRIEYTAPNTPQQNAPVENAIWRLMKGGTICRRSAAAQFDLPDFSVIPGLDPRADGLWLESVRYIAACYNRCGTKANPGNISPHEAFTGKKPDAIVVPFFQPVVLRVVRASKLDDQSEGDYFLGESYQHGRSTARLLKRSTGRVCHSRDFVFCVWSCRICPGGGSSRCPRHAAASCARVAAADTFATWAFAAATDVHYCAAAAPAPTAEAVWDGAACRASAHFGVTLAPTTARAVAWGRWAAHEFAARGDGTSASRGGVAASLAPGDHGTSSGSHGGHGRRPHGEPHEIRGETRSSIVGSGKQRATVSPMMAGGATVADGIPCGLVARFARREDIDIAIMNQRPPHDRPELPLCRGIDLRVPKTFAEATSFSYEHRNLFIDAMRREFHGLLSAGTFTVAN